MMLSGQPLPDSVLRTVWKQVLESADFAARQQEVQDFNKVALQYIEIAISDIFRIKAMSKYRLLPSNTKTVFSSIFHSLSNKITLTVQTSYCITTMCVVLILRVVVQSLGKCFFLKKDNITVA